MTVNCWEGSGTLLVKLYDECHAKIDLFKVQKIGNFLVFKIVKNLLLRSGLSLLCKGTLLWKVSQIL